jgi:hypothetical protein
MAVILAPHGPLSLPWENTTVDAFLLIKKSPSAAVKHRMVLEEQLAGALQETRPIIDCLRTCADLVGSPAAGVYLLLSRRLRVRTLWNGAPEAEIVAGELVGEAGWLLGESYWLGQRGGKRRRAAQAG